MICGNQLPPITPGYRPIVCTVEGKYHMTMIDIPQREPLPAGWVEFCTECMAPEPHCRHGWLGDNSKAVDREVYPPPSRTG